MSVKKTDKIIAIVGVLIIVVSAIAIFVYSDLDDGTDGNGDDETDDMLTFPVELKPKERKGTIDNPDTVVQDKLLSPKNYEGVITVKEQYLSQIDIKIDYTDKETGLLFGLLAKNSGQDKLTVTVLDSSEKEVGTTTITGSGNDTIIVKMDPKGLIMNPDPIEAESLSDASVLLEEMYDEPEEEVSLTVKASVQTGESPLRLFAWLKEKLLKQESFDLDITYHYYQYEIGEPMEDDNDEDDDNDTALTQESAYGTGPFTAASLYAI